LVLSRTKKGWQALRDSFKANGNKVGFKNNKTAMGHYLKQHELTK
jgi:hypothetical protein